LPSLCQISDKVIGSDIGETFRVYQRLTLREIKKNCPNLKLMEIDARYLSTYIAENSCDVIIAVSVLEHIREYRQTISEIKKCLRPSGIFICSVPTENRLYKFCRKILGYSGDYHEGFNFAKLRNCLRKRFKEVNRWYTPLMVPIFFTGVYTKTLG
jgi:predicted SAM-dependent methyltransferase